MSSAADSTIGMTAYNILAMHTDKMTVTEILHIARAQHRDLTLLQMQRALDRLVSLARVKFDDGGYSHAASSRLMVVSRDLRDFDPTTMEGGWSGWLAKDPRIRDGVGLRPIEALLGQTVPKKTEVTK